MKVKDTKDGPDAEGDGVRLVGNLGTILERTHRGKTTTGLHFLRRGEDFFLRRDAP